MNNYLFEYMLWEHKLFEAVSEFIVKSDKQVAAETFKYQIFYSLSKCKIFLIFC